MPPAKAKAAPAPAGDSDSGPPSESSDDESPAKASAPAAAAKTKVPAKAAAPAASEEAEAKEPLLPAGESSKSDAPEETPKTPRDKFREKSRSTTPRTPREPASLAGAPAAAAAAAATAAAPATAAPTNQGPFGKAVDIEAGTEVSVGAVTGELSKVRIDLAEAAKVKEAATAGAKQALEDSKKLFEEMKNDLPPQISLDKLPENKRMEEYINNLAKQAEGKAPPGIVDKLVPVLLKIIGVFLAIQPWIDYVVRYAKRIWAMVPTNVAMMMFGASLCYFGGAYTASIAAIEAFRTMGGARAQAEFEELMQQIKKVEEKSKEDDVVDDDGDGVADVDQISQPELIRRKIILMMRTIDDPVKIQLTVASIWAASLAVFATLKLEFAVTTAMALGIVDMIKFPVVRMLTPSLLSVLGTDLKHWCTPTIESLLAVLAIIFAWLAKTAVTAFYASFRGGRIFATAFFTMIVEQSRAGINVCPGLVDQNFDFNESVLDEIVGYIIAAQGFMFQMTSGFFSDGLPFPINILLGPITIVDLIIKSFMGSDCSAQ